MTLNFGSDGFVVSFLKGQKGGLSYRAVCNLEVEVHTPLGLCRQKKWGADLLLILWLILVVLAGGKL